MRILLVQPGSRLGEIGFHVAAQTEPLALETLAATLPDHDVQILDLRLEADLPGTLARFAPEVVAVTALTTEVYAAQAVLEAVKTHAAEIFTVVGGHHATLVPADFHRASVDAICLGEGDETFPALIAALAAGRAPEGVPGLVLRQRDGQFLQSPGVPIEVDLQRLRLPRRDLVLRYRPEYFLLYFQPDTSVATGRGCPFRCNFCSVAEFYRGRTSQMCPERVVAEVSAVQTDHITFMDDNFLMGHRRAGEIARRIEAAGIRHRYSMQCRSDSIVRHPEVMEQWARIGLHGVLLGLEGASDTLLAGVNKKSTVKANDEAIHILQANGIIVWGAFIIDPDWTADDFKLLEDYVATNNITHTQFTVLTPLPGTDLYRERRDQLLTDDYTCFDALHAVLPTKLPREEFYRHFAGLHGKPHIQANYDLVSEGRISLAEFKRGYRILKSLSQWENYTENDPILRSRPYCSRPASCPPKQPSTAPRNVAGALPVTAGLAGSGA